MRNQTQMIFSGPLITPHEELTVIKSTIHKHFFESFVDPLMGIRGKPFKYDFYRIENKESLFNTLNNRKGIVMYFYFDEA